MPFEAKRLIRRLELAKAMDIGLLPSGLFMGFSLAVGVGPVNVLTIRRALTDGYPAALWSGFGAATADAIFAVIVGLGLASLSQWIAHYASSLQVVGALFLIGWGVRVAFTRVDPDPKKSSAGRILFNYTTTFFLTLLNPANLATFALAGAGLGLLDRKLSAGGVAVLVLGVFIGSMLWWSTLSVGAVTLRKRFIGDMLPMVNRVAGALIIAFGIALLFVDASPHSDTKATSAQRLGALDP